VRFLLGFGAAGDVRTTTMKALARPEFEEIARKLWQVCTKPCGGDDDAAEPGNHDHA
jgi:hypothetical protein